MKHDDSKAYFDYKSQTWVTGQAGREIRIKQLRETLEVLQGPNGANYLKFEGSKLTKVEAIAACIDQLNELELR